jgi:hypothetical protein
MLSDHEAREVIARAEGLGFVREPTLGGTAGYALYLHEDAQEALQWLRDDIGIDPDALLRDIAE